MEIKFTKVDYQDFHNLTFSIPETGICGITGKGKTTLLNLISGTLKTEGTITFAGEILSNKTRLSITKKIGFIDYLFQNKYNKTTIEEYMNYMISYYKLNMKDPTKKIVDSLKIANLKQEYLKRNINTLSTSEKKLFQIALCLITNPKVILLDEPFINLDTKNQKKLFRLLTQLNEKYKITIVIASHDSEMLYRYTNHLIILKNYKILKEGNTKSLYENVKYLLKEKIEVPDIVLFTYKAKINKKIKIDYHRDIRDLIKDIYKHV